jgi:peptidoglycan hydrolase CwlO-like protein
MRNNINLVLRYLEKIYKVWELPFISQFKNLFAWIGLLTGIYLLIFLLTIRPNEVANFEQKEKELEKNISENQNQIKDLNRNNKDLLSQNEELEEKLKKIQEKYIIQQKKYEKEISRINNLSNKQLSRLFAESFEEI